MQITNTSVVHEFAATEDAEVVVIQWKSSRKSLELEDEEKAMFLEELGISESGLDKLIKASPPAESQIPSSQPVKTNAAPGPSKEEQRRLRLGPHPHRF